MKRWYEANIPHDDFRFHPPASERQISEAEQAIGLPFPLDLKQSLRTHGAFSNVAIGGYGYTLLSPGEMVETHIFRKRVADSGYSSGWDFSWIPLSESGGGGHDVLDTTTGRILDFHIEQDKPKVIAPSFRAWIESYVFDLEAGKFRYDKEDQWLVPVDGN